MLIGIGLHMERLNQYWVNVHFSSSSIHVDHDDYNGVESLQTMVSDVKGVHQEDKYEPSNPSA